MSPGAPVRCSWAGPGRPLVPDLGSDQAHGRKNPHSEPLVSDLFPGPDLTLLSIHSTVYRPEPQLEFIARNSHTVDIGTRKVRKRRGRFTNRDIALQCVSCSFSDCDSYCIS